MKNRRVTVLIITIILAVLILACWLFIRGDTAMLLCYDQYSKSSSAVAKNEARLNTTKLDGHQATRINSSKVQCNEAGVHGATTFATYEAEYPDAQTASQAVINAFGGQPGRIDTENMGPGVWEPFDNGEKYRKYRDGLSDEQYTKQSSQQFEQYKQSGEVTIAYIKQDQSNSNDGYDVYYEFSEPFVIPYETYFRSNEQSIPTESYYSTRLKNISDVIQNYPYLSSKVKSITIMLFSEK